MSKGLFGELGASLFGDQSENYDDVQDTDLAGKYGYTPTDVQTQTYDAAQEGGNALAGLHGDAGGQGAQRRALAQLEGASHGGLNAADRAALFQTQQQMGQQAHGQQGAILQGAAARGASTAGSTLAAQLSAQQAAQEAAAGAGAAVAGQSADRALGASQAAAGVGGAMDQAATTRQAVTGQAQNSINARNTASTNAAREYGARARNAGNQFNAGRQDASHQFNAGLAQQDYGNKLSKRGAIAGAERDAAQSGYGLIKDVARGGGAAYSAYGGGGGGEEIALSRGGAVPGHSLVSGDSEKNDVVPAMLSPGEVVIPRSALTAGPHGILSFLEKETGMHFAKALKARKVK